jgi:hypothetical protein
MIQQNKKTFKETHERDECGPYYFYLSTCFYFISTHGLLAYRVSIKSFPDYKHFFTRKLRAVHRLREDCSPLSTGTPHDRSQRVTIPDAVKIQF